MDSFLTISIIGSIVLTILLNLFPMFFPSTADKIQRKIEESARRSIEQQEDDSQPDVKVFFPWKAMLVGSIVLTLLVNVVGYFSR
jgi:hypothetical protein